MWIFFRLPEPTNLTYGELDKLFDARVPARQFQKAAVDLFATDQEKIQKSLRALEKQDIAGTTEHLEG